MLIAARPSLLLARFAGSACLIFLAGLVGSARFVLRYRPNDKLLIWPLPIAKDIHVNVVSRLAKRFDAPSSFNGAITDIRYSCSAGAHILVKKIERQTRLSEAVRGRAMRSR